MQHSPIRVFVTDDHPIVTTGLAAILHKKVNCQIVGIAHSQKEMIEQIQLVRPQVLLLDLNIPGSDFYDNIKLAKQLSPWTKILIYTSYYGPDLKRSLQKVGVAGCLLKGVKPKEIIRAIHQIHAGEIYVPVIPKSALTTTPSTLEDNFRKRLTLSRREQEILGLISSGLTSQIIGEKLFISKHTVETHRKNILRKLDFSSSTELVKFAVQQGLVS